MFAVHMIIEQAMTRRIGNTDNAGIPAWHVNTLERACRWTHNDGWEEAEGELDLLWPRQHVVVPQNGQDAVAA